jgi:hypothetical protein
LHNDTIVPFGKYQNFYVGLEISAAEAFSPVKTRWSFHQPGAITKESVPQHYFDIKGRIIDPAHRKKMPIIKLEATGKGKYDRKAIHAQ